MAKLRKIDITLEGKNSSRLAMKEYSRDYTDIPNTALPEQMKEDISVMYQYLMDKELPLNDYTFLIKSKEGKFSKVFSPAVFASKVDKTLVIKWGAEFLPIPVTEGLLQLSNKKKAKFAFKEEKINGYKTTVLAISFSKDKEMYSMSFPIKKAKLEEELPPDVLDMHLEENDIDSLLDLISEPPSASGNENNDSYTGTGEKLVGDIVKLSYLPIGEYDLVGIRRYQNSYGTQHLVQTIIPEEQKFVATVSYQDDTDTWVSEEKEITGKVILKANTKLNKLLMSDPVISEEVPAKLLILEKGEYNGYATAKIDLICKEYTADKELFDINF